MSHRSTRAGARQVNLSNLSQILRVEQGLTYLLLCKNVTESIISQKYQLSTFLILFMFQFVALGVLVN